MAQNYLHIKELLQQKAEYQARLNLLPYDGTPEIKERNGSKYLYIRKRVAGKLTSTYVDVYSEELHTLLLKTTKEARELNKKLRRINKQLSDHGYTDSELPERISQNLEFARANMKTNIYDQAVLEGVATSFPQTEDILENGIVYGVSASDIQKVLNLKHAWEFILDSDVIQCESDYYLLCQIARLVNEGFLRDGGKIRGIPVSIGGSRYIPAIPIESVVKETLQEILAQEYDHIDIAIHLCLYCMRTQIFTDGNKRASVIFANHYLISHGEGLLVIPEKHVAEFKMLLVEFYEENDDTRIGKFMKQHCWKNF